MNPESNNKMRADNSQFAICVTLATLAIALTPGAAGGRLTSADIDALRQEGACYVDYGDALPWPDLIVESSSISPATGLNPGDTVTLSDEIANQGAEAADRFWTSWYISTDPEVTTDDLLWPRGWRAIDGLGGGEMSAAAHTALWPDEWPYNCPGATFYLAAMADDEDEVLEADETNNWGQVWTIVLAGTNEPPILSTYDGWPDGVDPDQGDPSTVFTFRVHYFDPEGTAPTLAQAMIDGRPFDLTGAGHDSDYAVSVSGATLSAGTHEYHFYFEDACGLGARLPASEWVFHVSGPQPGLVGYWTFDEGSGGTAHDCSGHGNDGAIYGASWIAGLQGFALNYDGVNDCVMCENTVGDDFTLQAWIWTTAESLHGQHAFEGNAILWADYFGIQWSDWSLAVLNNCVAFTTGNPDSTIIGTTHVNDGRWHQVVAVRKRGAYKRLYVDAVLEGQGSTNSQLLDDQSVMCIGGNPIDHRYLRGLIDEVRIYNGELSAEAIEQLYHHPSGFCPGDLNCDGATDSSDIDAFVLALADPGGYQTAFPCCKRSLADCNADGAVNAFDIDPFVLLLTGAPVDLACCYEGYSPVQCEEGVELMDCVAGGGRWDIDATLCADLTPPCGEYYGACCDPSDGACQDEVPPSNCGSLWYFQRLCSELDPPCGDPGACCDDLAVECTDGVLAAHCDGRHGGGTCAGLSPACGTVCTHRVDLYENHYDGWNGNTLDVYVDGVLVLDGITLPGGLGPLSFEFLAGTGSVIHTVYHAIGSLPYMPYYRIFDGLGTLIIQDGGSYVEPSGVTVHGSCEAMHGACCDPMTGICDNDVGVFDCTAEFHEDAQCEELSPPCGNPGACCDDWSGTCTDDMPLSACLETVEHYRFTPYGDCAEMNPPCGEVRGACCDGYSGVCRDDVAAMDCAGTRFDALETCDELSPVCGNPGACCDDTTATCLDEVFELLCPWRFQAATTCFDMYPVCVVPPPCEDGLINAPGSWSGTTAGAGDDCALRAGEDLTIRVNIPADFNWQFDLCASSPAWDTYMFIGTDCCTATWYNDDGCASYALLSTLSLPGLPAGTYFVDIEPYNSSEVGNVTLTVAAYEPEDRSDAATQPEPAKLEQVTPEPVPRTTGLRPDARQ